MSVNDEATNTVIAEVQAREIVLPVGVIADWPPGLGGPWATSAIPVSNPSETLSGVVVAASPAAGDEVAQAAAVRPIASIRVIRVTNFFAISFLNGRGTAEQWIKEGKYAMNWTRLSCHKFVANQVRLWLFILAYNLGNFVRRMALPEGIQHWSLTSIQTRLIKIGGRLVRHARRLVFQLAEVMVSRDMFDEMLERIGRLRLVPG